jgi:hypothetical protein
VTLVSFTLLHSAHALVQSRKIDAMGERWKQIGSSLGAIVVFDCLVELHARGLSDIVFDAILISFPLAPSPSRWSAARHVVSRRLVNVRSSNDWTLAITARMHALGRGVAGLTEVTGVGDGVENVDASECIKAHLALTDGKTLDEVLRRVKL